MRARVGTHLLAIFPINYSKRQLSAKLFKSSMFYVTNWISAANKKNHRDTYGRSSITPYWISATNNWT